MLILTRSPGANGQPGTTIQIGEDIWITVLRSKRGLVTLGVVAPPAVRILRDDCQTTVGKPYIGPPDNYSARGDGDGR